MSHDRSTVEAVVRELFRWSCNEGNADKLAARSYTHRPPTCAGWKETGENARFHRPRLARIASGKSPYAGPKAKPPRGFHRPPSTARRFPPASSKVRCQLPPRYFTTIWLA